jgi:hypothetical protein
VTVRGDVNGRTPNALEFRVGSQRVSIAGNPTFEPAGTSAADTRNGSDLEVTGTLVDGLLVASKVRLHKPGHASQGCDNAFDSSRAVISTIGIIRS